MKKKQIGILCVLFAFVFLLGGVILSWFLRYRAVGLALLEEKEGAYHYNGKLLVAEGEENALLFRTLGALGLEALPREDLDLTPFGFEGKTFSYFRVNTDTDYGFSFVNFYPTDPAYEPFWPVCMGGRIVYLDEEGKKFRIHTEEKLCYPIFADSIEGVDPYGRDVIAFSANATYAVALAGDEVTVYQTDPMDESLRVVQVKKHSLAQYGENAAFGAFVGNSQVYFTVEKEGKTRFVALDCATGQTALSALDSKGEYGPAVNRLFAQRLNPETDKKAKDGESRLVWNHLLLGTEWKSPLSAELDGAVLVAVSPKGEYAVFEADGRLLVCNEKRIFFMDDLIGEKETVKETTFLYDNVLALCVEGEAGTSLRTYKICF